MTSCFLDNFPFTDTVISGDVWNEEISVQNAFIWDIPEVFWENYWISPDGAQGEFILEFDQPRVVSVIILVNTHNGIKKDRGTKEFKVNMYRLFLTLKQQNYSFILRKSNHRSM